MEPKLQEAFSANTAIKFAGGVSAKDARSLAPMLYTQAEFIEAQPRGSFASHIRGVTKAAVPLQFPFGYLEEMPKMSAEERQSLQEKMRDRYAVHHSQLREKESDESGDGGEVSDDADEADASEPKPKKHPPGHTDTTPSGEW